MPTLKAVLFDLDGTLLDSAYDITNALNNMLAGASLPQLSLAEIRPLLGEGVMELCRKALLATGGAVGGDLYPWVQKFVTHYRAITPDEKQIFPGVRETLEALIKKGVAIGLCTNKEDSSMHKIMQQLNLERFFGFMAGGNTFEVHKPHPGHVLGVLEKLGALPEESVFVGDGPHDVNAARAAHVASVVVTHGQKNIDFPNPDAVIDDIPSLLPQLTKMGFSFSVDHAVKDGP